MLGLLGWSTAAGQHKFRVLGFTALYRLAHVLVSSHTALLPWCSDCRWQLNQASPGVVSALLLPGFCDFAYAGGQHVHIHINAVDSSICHASLQHEQRRSAGLAKCLHDVLQGPFALQDYHSWVSSGHFIDSMTVYHTSDTQTPYTLAALFTQAAPQHQPPLPPDPTPPAAATPLLGLHAGLQTLPLPSSSSQHPQQQQQLPCWHQRQDLAPKAKAIKRQDLAPNAKAIERQHLAPKAKAIAEQLRQQLLESGKQAVYQLLKKNVHEALPGLVETARAARAAAAAQEAAEEERRRLEAEQEAARAAAEAEAKARADAL